MVSDFDIRVSTLSSDKKEVSYAKIIVVADYDFCVIDGMRWSSAHG